MESNPHTHVLVCVLTHTRSPLYASQSLSPSNTSNLAHPPVSSLAFFPLCFPFPPSTLILLLSSFSPSFRHLCGGCGDKQRSYLSIYQNGWHSMADTHQVCPCVCVCVRVFALYGYVSPSILCRFSSQCGDKDLTVFICENKATKIRGYPLVCVSRMQITQIHIGHSHTLKYKMNSPQALWKGDSLFFYLLYCI